MGKSQRVTHGRSHAGPAPPYPDTWPPYPGCEAMHTYQEIEAAQPLIPGTCNFSTCHCSLCQRRIWAGETFFQPHRSHPTIAFVCYHCGSCCRLEFPAHHAGQPVSLDPFGGGQVDPH